MTTLAEYERSLQPSEADITAELRKDLAAGAYSRCTKQDFHEIIQALAADIRSPSETPEQAYARAISKLDAGRTLFNAMRAAPDTAPHVAEKHKFIAEIQARADEKFPEIPTPQRRFSHAIDCDKHGRAHDRICKALYERQQGRPRPRHGARCNAARRRYP